MLRVSSSLRLSVDPLVWRWPMCCAFAMVTIFFHTHVVVAELPETLPLGQSTAHTLEPAESTFFDDSPSVSARPESRPPEMARQEPRPPISAPDWTRLAASGMENWTSPEQIGGTIRTMLGIAVVSLAPAILLMTTSYVRISIVLGLLRQALGASMIPSNQVVTALSLFLTMLIMTPVWQQVYDGAIEPYSRPESQMSMHEAWTTGVQPVRKFMSDQIKLAGNSDDVWLFYQYSQKEGPTPSTYDEVPITALIPAFMLSELKVAFLIGFQVLLPFLILDIVVSTVTVSMGMLMLPPTMVALPLKLLLFVLVDGWHLVVGMLLQSFA